MDVVSYLLGKKSSGGGGSSYNAVLDGTDKTSGTIINCIKEIGYFDTSSYTNMYNMFSGCSSLETVDLLDTSNVTTMNGMFYNCNKLKNIPQFNTAKVTDFNRMFGNIGVSLTDESLNNILGMCINATSYTGTKTLAALSLNEYRAPLARVQALPNYQAFLDAGWSIGY